jgi:hypothetical protein
MRAKTAGLATVLMLCAFSGGARAETPMADEYEIKAEMLASVFKLVDWPPAKIGDGTGPFVIGIAGSDDMSAALSKAIAKAPGGRTASGHPIAIRRISGVEEIEQCHVVFVGGSDHKRLRAILEAARSLPILTIGESDNFASSGGMVGLVEMEGHIQVEVNLSAAQSSGLSISSRLLRIAIIRGGGV